MANSVDMTANIVVVESTDFVVVATLAVPVSSVMMPKVEQVVIGKETFVPAPALR